MVDSTATKIRVGVAKAGTKFVRTSNPQWIPQLFKLKLGDEIFWELNKYSGSWIIMIQPVIPIKPADVTTKYD